MNLKRILFIIGFIILVFAFGTLIYFVFIKDLVAPSNTNTNINAEPSANVNTGGLPVINGIANTNQTTGISNVNRLMNVNRVRNVNQAQVDKVAQGGLTLAETAVSQQAEFAAPTASGSGIRFYDKVQDKFFRIDADGLAKEMSNQIFPEAKEVSWSPQGDKAIITFPDDSKVMYDFDTQEQVTLPKEWDGIEFSPSGEKIGFKNISAEEQARWLAVSSPDGTEVELIEPLGDKANDVAVNWSPTGQVVALYRQAYSGDSQEAFLIGLHGENFKSIITEGRGFEGLWSPQGDQLLYNVYNAESNYNPKLYLVDAAGDQVGANKIDLGLKTWSSRCTFATTESFLYCAVPEYLPLGSGIYPEVAGSTNDSIYKIDVNTGTKSLLALPTFLTGERDYTINSLFLSNDERTLYFSDGNTGNVYSIELR